MPQVELPDGRVVALPDNPTPEQQAQIAQLLQAAKGQQPSTLSKVGSTVKGGLADLGRGAIKGVGGVLDLIETQGQMPPQRDEQGRVFWPGPGGQRVYGSAADQKAADTPTYGSRLQGFAEDIFPTPKDSGPGRRYARATLEGIGGAVSGGPNKVVNLVAGGSAGAAGQVAEEYQPGNPLLKFVASVLGGVTGGAATGRATAARPQSAELAREALEGISPEMLQRAQTFQAQQAARGVNIDLAQALESVGVPSGNLATIRNRLAESRHGTNVQQTLRNQPAQIHAEAEKVVQGLPGQNYGQAQSANIAQETATQVIEAAKKARSEAVRELYAKAGNLTPEQRDELIALAQEFANRPGAATAVKAAAAEFARKLRGEALDATETAAPIAAAGNQARLTPAAQKALATQKAQAEAIAAQKAAEAPPTRALDVDTAIAEMMGPYQPRINVADPKTTGQMKGLGGALNKKFQELSPEVRAAEAEFQRISEQTINPLRQGEVGRQAGRGYTADTQATMTKFGALMERGTDPTSKVSDIRTLARGLAKQDPQAFSDAFKSWISGKVQSVIKPGVDDVLTNDPQVAAKLDSAVFGSAKQWQGIKDAVVTQAEISGQNPAEVLRGLDNLRRLVRGASNRPGAVGGLSPKETVEIAGRNPAAEGARVFGFLPLERLARKIEDTTMKRTFRQFDEILTTPEGAKVLAELGKVPVMSRKAQTLLGTFYGIQGTEDPQQFPGNTGQ